MAELDLHLHSTVSDGRLAPAELVRLAAGQGVRVMALTDHDSTDGVAEARVAAAGLGVRVIAGVELSTEVPGASIHVLGLFVDDTDRAFQEAVRQFREARVSRARLMVEALERLGYRLSLERVFEIAGEGSVGRPHVAQALLEAGHTQTMAEAFERFIGHGGPAYFEGFRLAPAEAVRLVHAAGGIASWAHPCELDGKAFADYLPLLLEAGIDSLEAYYSKDYGAETQAMLLDACTRYELVPTVGSDFHGFKSMDRLPGSVESPNDLLSRLEARREVVARRRRASVEGRVSVEEAWVPARGGREQP